MMHLGGKSLIASSHAPVSKAIGTSGEEKTSLFQRYFRDERLILKKRFPGKKVCDDASFSTTDARYWHHRALVPGRVRIQRGEWRHPACHVALSSPLRPGRPAHRSGKLSGRRAS